MRRGLHRSERRPALLRRLRVAVRARGRVRRWQLRGRARLQHGALRRLHLLRPRDEQMPARLLDRRSVRRQRGVLARYARLRLRGGASSLRGQVRLGRVGRGVRQPVRGVPDRRGRRRGLRGRAVRVHLRRRAGRLRRGRGLRRVLRQQSVPGPRRRQRHVQWRYVRRVLQRRRRDRLRQHVHRHRHGPGQLRRVWQTAAPRPTVARRRARPAAAERPAPRARPSAVGRA